MPARLCISDNINAELEKSYSECYYSLHGGI